tara:strand:- start:4555 stop:6012 length:1458 start_codon:yes stop_codon:yes gene_type:complete
MSLTLQNIVNIYDEVLLHNSDDIFGDFKKKIENKSVIKSESQVTTPRDTFYLYTTGIANSGLFNCQDQNLVTPWNNSVRGKVLGTIFKRFDKIIINHYDPLYSEGGETKKLFLTNNKQNDAKTYIQKNLINVDNKINGVTSTFYVDFLPILDFKEYIFKDHPYLILDFARVFTEYPHTVKTVINMASDQYNLTVLRIGYLGGYHYMFEFELFKIHKNRIETYIDKMIESNIQYPSDDPIEYIDKLSGSNALIISIYQSLFQHIQNKTAKSFIELNDLGNNIKNIITKNEIGFIFFELLWGNKLTNIPQPGIEKLIIDRLLKQHNNKICALITKYTHDSPKPVSIPDKYHKYIDAHNGTTGHPSYEEALREIQNKCTKRGHWIWYIFPQPPDSRAISPTSTTYSLNTGDVKDYLNVSILKEHYLEIVEQLVVCLTDKGKNLFDIFDTDDVKVISSLKSFKKGTTHNHDHTDIYTLCETALTIIGEE